MANYWLYVLVTPCTQYSMANYYAYYVCYYFSISQIGFVHVTSILHWACYEFGDHNHWHNIKWSRSFIKLLLRSNCRRKLTPNDNRLCVLLNVFKIFTQSLVAIESIEPTNEFFHSKRQSVLHLNSINSLLTHIFSSVFLAFCYGKCCYLLTWFILFQRRKVNILIANDKWDTSRKFLEWKYSTQYCVVKWGELKQNECKFFIRTVEFSWAQQFFIFLHAVIIWYKHLFVDSIRS